jgi:hypothetical protein
MINYTINTGQCKIKLNFTFYYNETVDNRLQLKLRNHFEKIHFFDLQLFHKIKKYYNKIAIWFGYPWREGVDYSIAILNSSLVYPSDRDSGTI